MLSAQNRRNSENFVTNSLLDKTAKNSETVDEVIFGNTFDENIDDWLLFNEDGDTFNWVLERKRDNDIYFEENGFIMSLSGLNVSSFTPDNWIVTPEIDLTNALGKVTLKYLVSSMDSEKVNDNYAVYVSTSSNVKDQSSFVQVFKENVLPINPTERRIDLTSFVGKKIYVSLRHFDVTGQSGVIIDEFAVLGRLKEEAVDFGSHLFYDSFETYMDFAVGGISQSNKIGKIGQLTLIDQDRANTFGVATYSYPNGNIPKSFMVFNSKKTVPELPILYYSDWSAKTGDKAMVAFASRTSSNNDWLISPKISLAKSDNVLTFQAKAADDSYPKEAFNVLISTTDMEVGSFKLLGQEIIDNGIVFSEYKYDLSEYNDQEVYIAIQCTSDDQFGFVLDDFIVDGDNLSISDINKNKITNVYPNPVENTFRIDFGSTIDKNKTTIELFTIQGEKVKSFTYADQYDISYLPKGIYVLKINDGKTKVVKKLIKK